MCIQFLVNYLKKPCVLFPEFPSIIDMTMSLNFSAQDLWTQFHVPLHAFIRHRVSDAAAADDILQDVFVRIHTRINTLREHDKIQAWIYQIARNAIADYYRARHADLAVPSPFEEPARFTEAVIPSEAQQDDLAQELAPSVRAMIDALPADYREALILTDVQGMSQVELAQHLGISLSGAKSRVQRARAKVKQMLLDCCHFEFDRLGGVVNYYPRVDCCRQCACK